MSDDQPRDSTGNPSGGRFRPREHREPDVTLEPDEDFAVSRSEAKALNNLDRTLDALRTSLDKGMKIVKLGKQRFDEDWIVQDAACNIVIQLTEEAKRLPSSFRNERSEIPWRTLIGMRNIVAHDYVDVDLLTIWKVLEDNFPEVERSIFPED